MQNDPGTGHMLSRPVTIGDDRFQANTILSRDKGAYILEHDDGIAYAIVLDGNRGFAEWCEVFGDPVVAISLLDCLLHHAVVVQIEGASYRLRSHADLIPEHV